MPEDVKKIETQALTIPEKAEAIKITNTGSYENAGSVWKEIKAFRAKVAETFDPLIKAAHATHKAAVAKKKEVDDPLDQAQRKIKRLMGEYDEEQERIRAEKERKLQEQARKEEEERRLAEAEAAEAAGETEVAEAILEEEVEQAAVIVPKTTPKVSGMSFRVNWNFQITDETQIPREYLKPDEVKIGQVVRALKDKLSIPGIRIYKTKV